MVNEVLSKKEIIEDYINEINIKIKIFVCKL